MLSMFFKFQVVFGIFLESLKVLNIFVYLRHVRGHVAEQRRERWAVCRRDAPSGRREGTPSSGRPRESCTRMRVIHEDEEVRSRVPPPRRVGKWVRTCRCR